MATHTTPTPTTRLTLRQAVVADIKRNTRGVLEHLVGSAAHIGADAVALGLFFIGGEDQRRMVEWTRRHS